MFVVSVYYESGSETPDDVVGPFPTYKDATNYGKAIEEGTYWEAHTLTAPGNRCQCDENAPCTTTDCEAKTEQEKRYYESLWKANVPLKDW